MGSERIGYRRVSSQGQNPDRQLDGIQVDRVFTDYASGKNASRPELERLIQNVRSGDTVIVHSMDRLARNLMDLLQIVQDLTDRGIKIEFLKETLTFSGESTGVGKVMLSILGAVAEFERAMIRERQREGIAKAKEKGIYKGRKPSLTPEQVTLLLEMAAAKTPIPKLMRKFDVSRSTIYSVLRAAKPAPSTKEPLGDSRPSWVHSKDVQVPWGKNGI